MATTSNTKNTKKNIGFHDLLINTGFHDLLVYFISKLSIPWTSMACATCNSFGVWWGYMAHIFLCLFIFPKSNHSSPYDDVPCVLFVLLICLSLNRHARRDLLQLPFVADINPEAGLFRAERVSG